MIPQYVEAALNHAHFETIEDKESFYGEIEGLQGVWAAGKTPEECRANLAEVLEGWILVRISQGLPIPPVDGVTLSATEREELLRRDIIRGCRDMADVYDCSPRTRAT